MDARSPVSERYSKCRGIWCLLQLMAGVHVFIMDRHAYNRRSEAVLPKLSKSMSAVKPKLTSCAVVQ